MVESDELIEDDRAQDDAPERRYRAPALEKGLDILELLAAESAPLTLTAIVNRLARSHGELFRMVQVLEYRGYIEQDPAADGYRLSDRLFSLSMQRPATRNLIEVALPVMRRLSIASGQSCHLVVFSLGETVVVARVESSEQLGFSVRVGYRKPFYQTASGSILYAFQPDEIRRRWDGLIDPGSDHDRSAFLQHAETIRARGYEVIPSRFVSGVTDLSAPVLRGGFAAAALTMPFLKKLQASLGRREALEMLTASAREISDQLVEVDNRV